MYSSRIASFFYIAAAVLLATMTQLVSATPINPDRTPADVISENRNMACRMGECYIHNGTNSTGAVAAADAAASSAVSTPIASPLTTNGAITYQPAVILPAMIAGTSLLLLL